MAAFLNMKIAVSSPEELRAVVRKLVSQGYGIGSNREAVPRDATYSSVFTHDDGMILFGRNVISLGQRGTSFDRSESTAVLAADFLAA